MTLEEAYDVLNQESQRIRDRIIAESQNIAIREAEKIKRLNQIGPHGCTGVRVDTGVSYSTYRPELVHTNDVDMNAGEPTGVKETFAVKKIVENKAKLKRRSGVPRIFKYILWSMFVVLVGKLVTNAEIITVTIFNLITK